MDPFRTRDLCLQMGGGGAPQSPPISFSYAVQACFQKTSHHQHDLLHEHHCSRAFQTHHAGSPFANGGATSAQHPHFFKLYKATASIILSAKTEPIWPLSERVIKTSCVQMGGGGGAAPPPPPPSPPLFFLRRADLLCFQEHRTINQNCFKNPLCRQMGDVAPPPQLSRFLNLCKIVSSIILPPKTEPIWTLSDP